MTYAEGLDAEELAFQRLHGPWLLSTPADCAELLTGFDRPWWVASTPWHPGGTTWC